MVLMHARVLLVGIGYRTSWLQAAAARRRIRELDAGRETGRIAERTPDSYTGSNDHQATGGQ
jgi:hypothetical protein